LKPPSRSGSLLLEDLRFELDDGVESDRSRVLGISLSPLRFERLEPDISNSHGLLRSASAQSAVLHWQLSRQTSGVTIAYLCVVASYFTSSIATSKNHMVMSLMRVKKPSIQSMFTTRPSALVVVAPASGMMAEKQVRGWGVGTQPINVSNI
jgi:hypothetical protein